jgi:hypothetical protein
MQLTRLYFTCCFICGFTCGFSNCVLLWGNSSWSCARRFYSALLML